MRSSRRDHRRAATRRSTMCKVRGMLERSLSRSHRLCGSRRDIESSQVYGRGSAGSANKLERSVRRKGSPKRFAGELVCRNGSPKWITRKPIIHTGSPRLNCFLSMLPVDWERTRALLSACDAGSLSWNRCRLCDSCCLIKSRGIQAVAEPNNQRLSLINFAIAEPF